VCTSATTVLRCTLLGSAFGSNGPNVRKILDVLLAPDMLRTHHAALKVCNQPTLPSSEHSVNIQ
jgi:hypothetical protein